MNILALPAFSDNYIWMLHNEREAIVIDPGIAAPVISILQEMQLQLVAILTTHHHADHTGGVNELRSYLKEGAEDAVYGPTKDPIPKPYNPLDASSQLTLLGLDITVLEVPGHTLGHIAYYIASQPLVDKTQFEPVVFSGDALFVAGCGRMFEGTPTQMLASLDQFAALPSETKVYCAHEYTLSNLRFAQAVEPKNEEIEIFMNLYEKMRSNNRPTPPSTLKNELNYNPFLRSRTAAVIKSVQAIDPTAKNEVEIFAALRKWKDNF